MRWSCAALLTSLTLGLAHAQDDAPPPPAPEPLALSTDANTVRMVPLQPGQLPDLSVGGVLHPTCGKGVDPKAPCGLRWLPNGDLLVRRNGTIQDGYSRFSRDARGRMRERAVGAWPGRHGPELDPRRRRELSISALPGPWRDAGAADLNGDHLDDLLLTRKVGKGYTAFEYRIAFGKLDGTFDFSRAPVRILNRQWAAVFDLADVTGDGKPDLVYHHQPHGAAHPVTLYAVAGQGNGTFAPEAQRIVVAKGTSGAAMTGIVLEDFNEDGGVDLFLPPDDDVPDDGQAYVVLQGRNGLGKLQPSIDFEPKREGWTADRGHYLVQSCDVDLDGHRDLIAWFFSWSDERFTVNVHCGNGQAAFGPAQLLLQGKTKHKPKMAWRLNAIEW